MDACPKAFQKSGKHEAGSAKSKDAACALSHHARRTSLIELAASHHRLFHRKMLRGRKRHGQPVFRHRLRLCARIARKGHLLRQLIEPNEVDTGSKKLHKAHVSYQIHLVRVEFLDRVVGEQHRRRRQRLSPRSRLVQLIKKDDLGPIRDRLGDCQPIRGAQLARDDKHGLLFRNHWAFSEGLLNARAILPSGRAQARITVALLTGGFRLRLSTERNTTARQHRQRPRTRPAVTDERC